MTNGIKLLLIILALALIAAGVWYFFLKPKNAKIPPSFDAARQQNTRSWQEKSVLIDGQFADADAVDLGDGRYRLYYSEEPETAGFQGRVYSSISADGVNWTKEDGLRKTQAIFPDVIKLPDDPSTSSGQAKWRMYFQNGNVIKSATSTDGLNFTDESGTRIDAKETGFNLRTVGASSTTQLENGSYLMVYRGEIDEPYKGDDMVPNKTTQLYFWATSKDGLSFTKKGIAIDSRNNTLYGLTDGADWVNWDDGNLRVYFWSYKGVYYSVLENASTNDLQKFAEPVFTFTNNSDKMVKFPPNPPCDPTLVNIKNQWVMYYGQHTKGIYYATLN